MKIQNFSIAVSVLAMTLTSASMAMAKEDIPTVSNQNMAGVRELGAIALAASAGYGIEDKLLADDLNSKITAAGLSVTTLNETSFLNQFMDDGDFRLGLEQVVAKRGDAIRREFASVKSWLEDQGYTEFSNSVAQSIGDPGLWALQNVVHADIRHRRKNTGMTSSTTSTTNTTAGATRDAVPAG